MGRETLDAQGSPDPFPGLPLTTQRLRLRPYRLEDAPRLLQIYSDPQVMRYWSHAPWQRLEQAQDAIARDLQAQAQGHSLRLGLERVADGELIGQCTLFALSHPHARAEIGYALARETWGQGYMHEALRALVDYAWHVLGLHRLEADIDPRNTASAHVLQRLGFVHEGLLRARWRVAGELSDSAIWGLLRPTDR